MENKKEVKNKKGCEEEKSETEVVKNWEWDEEHVVQWKYKHKENTIT